MTRTQYISIAELNEILGTSYDDTDENLILIYEASELIKQYCWKFVEDYTVITAPDKLKLATAYQVKYMVENPGMDNIYAGNNHSVSIGQTSESVAYGGTGSQEWQKMSPKSIRYLKDTDIGEQPLVTRLL